MIHSGALFLEYLLSEPGDGFLVRSNRRLGQGTGCVDENEKDEHPNRVRRRESEVGRVGHFEIAIPTQNENALAFVGIDMP